MGEDFTVSSWLFVADEDRYKYVVKYSGDDFDSAIEVLKAEKKAGVGCVQFEDRSDHYYPKHSN